jgi:magnesium chelatase family protein
MHTKIYSATNIGIEAYQVDVEVDLAFGLINFFIVGLPDAAIKESKQRIQTALKNSGIKIPDRKITVNLAPAHLKKEGTLFDLPIAVGILQASGHISIAPAFLQETLFIGELSLDGGIKSIHGALPIACDLKKLGKRRLILPQANASEAAIIPNIEVIGVSNLVELVHYLQKELSIAATQSTFSDLAQPVKDEGVDFSDVKGQEYAKQALQIAAAGRHNILFCGPPGSGKTMLARRLPTIMPAMTFEESVSTTKIYSVSGKLHAHSLINSRPFRSPHHSISQAGLIGGGSFPRPGEASLAHNGILFLDELTEFKRTTLEALRQPIENKVVEIARVQQSVSFPSSFLLVAAYNPCPCGFQGDKTKECTCSHLQIKNYQDKLSGPLLDRIDIKIGIQSVSYQDATRATAATSSADLYRGVETALKAQRQRFGNDYTFNSMMNTQQVVDFCTLTPEAKILLEKAFEKLKLSMRSYHKILKLARTIADIQAADIIEPAHIQKAIMYKS